MLCATCDQVTTIEGLQDGGGVAKTLIDYLKRPAAVAMIKSKGMNLS
jgi:hypothetical protein